METNLPHLVVTEFERADYTGTGRGGGNNHTPPRVRNEHSERLKQQLAQAWEESKNDQVVYKAHRNGIYLEFKGEPGYNLLTKSLESRQGKDEEKWVRLLNVRSVKEDISDTTSETTYATVFVPTRQKEKFFKTIETYATKQTESGNPKHAALVESISSIRKALEIESFWQDDKSLIPNETPEWCEVWLSSDQPGVIEQFEGLLADQKINSKSGVIRFPERTIKVIQASRSQLETLTRLSDDIAEYRRAKETANFWLEMNNRDQADWVYNILDRLTIDESSNVSVCILDTGVNHGHPLIEPVLAPLDCQSVDPEWGDHDHHQHGTLMAGVCAYGDLQAVLTRKDPIRLRHRLESVKILPPGDGSNDPELWGYVTAQGVYKAEIQSPYKHRVTCMAIASEDKRDRGRPSSWSGELDQLCSGAEDENKRLVIVSAGNITSWDTAQLYPQAQITDPIHDPEQAWNALTVGAYTNLDQIDDPSLRGYRPIAPAGGLSPFSTTSLSWDDAWPIKPEILMEGGNSIPGVKDNSIDCGCNDLSLLSTYFKPHEALFHSFNMTSAATAQAAWFAAQIQAEYPSYWPETIRGLMVHSAEWTDILKQQFLDDNSKSSYKHLLRVCGYGVPSLEKAMYCASNSLTLISQSELQPFDKKENSSGYRTRDMHLYELPWPKETLLAFPDTAEVQMRVTLSYFIEPGPGEIGWKDRYRYPSHGLRFNINSPGESQDDFTRRINAAARDEENGHPGTASASDHWVLGKVRDKGSIHSDIWQGTAADLATSNLIAVYPTIGWWRERAHLHKWDKKTRYTLIVSIQTPEENVDIYTPVAVQIGIPIQVEI